MKIWEKIRKSKSTSHLEPAKKRLLKFKTFAWLDLRNYAQYAKNRKMIKVLDQHFSCKTKAYLVVSDDGKDLRWQIGGPLNLQLVMLESLLRQIHKGTSVHINQRN